MSRINPVMGRIAKPRRAPDETINVPMPKHVDVLVYYSTTRGLWISKVNAVAPDVDAENKKDGYFGSEWTHDKRPTPQELAEQLKQWLCHEVDEQLGLRPHQPRCKYCGENVPAGCDTCATCADERGP